MSNFLFACENEEDEEKGVVFFDVTGDLKLSPLVRIGRVKIEGKSLQIMFGEPNKPVHSSNKGIEMNANIIEDAWKSL